MHSKERAILKRKSLLIGIMLLLAMTLVACGGGDDGGSDDTSQTTTSATTAPQSQDDTTTTDTIVLNQPDLPQNDAGIALAARVNGVEITLPEFERAFQIAQTQMDAADLTALAATVLDQLIEGVIIRQGAEAVGITIDEAEITQILAEDQAQIGEGDAWENWLIQNNFTEEQYRQEIRDALLLAELSVAVAQQGQASNVVTQVHARHILLSTEAEAIVALARLEAGETFEAVAAEVSNDATTRENGGDLDWFVPEQLTTPELGAFALTLAVGDIGGPVVTTLGYHIVQLLETREVDFVAEEQAAIVQSTFEFWLEDQLNNASIERYWGA